METHKRTDIGFVLNHTYDLIRLNESRRAAQYLMRIVETDISWSAAPDDYVDSLLGAVNLEKLDSRCMTVIIRCTFRVKHLCPNWQPLLTKIKDEMIKRDMDYKGLLIGLI